MLQPSFPEAMLRDAHPLRGITASASDSSTTRAVYAKAVSTRRQNPLCSGAGRGLRVPSRRGRGDVRPLPFGA